MFSGIVQPFGPLTQAGQGPARSIWGDKFNNIYVIMEMSDGLVHKFSSDGTLVRSYFVLDPSEVSLIYCIFSYILSTNPPNKIVCFSQI